MTILNKTTCYFLLLISLSLILPGSVHAQAWSGIINSTRAVDWSGVGVENGIPSTLTRCTTGTGTNIISAYSGSAATINTALGGCNSGHYVELGSGTFTLSSAITMSTSGVTLRGQGASSTKLVISGAAGPCHLFYQSAFAVCAGAFNIGSDSADHTASYTAGYVQGTSNITLSSTTGLAVGSTLWLDQLDDPSDGYPAAGDLYVCNNEYPCSNQGGGSYFRGGRTQTVGEKVTNISGSTVTISPPVALPNWRSGQSPGAWWGDTSHVLTNVGIENLTVDFSSNGALGMQMVNCTNCWVKGTRWIKNSASGSFFFHMLVINCFHCQVESNYLYGPVSNSGSLITNYQISPHIVSSSLFTNNIQHRPISAYVPNDPTFTTVYSYNFVTDSWFTGPGPIEHTPAAMGNLYEGNNTSGFLGDIIHGPHYFETLFRNHFDGEQNNPPANVDTAISFRAHNRFNNVLGNIIGDTHHNTYETLNAAGPDSIYSFGWQSDDSVAPGSQLVANDARVKATTFRFGNWDKVTNATRWCGNSGSTGWASTCSSTSEVPTGITNYSNSVPASETFPNSFYLSGQPSWWVTAYGTPPWPAIGPDVSGGSLSNTGGHAYKIPARLCFENAANDSAYPSSSPRIKVFDAATCYTGTGDAISPVAGNSGIVTTASVTSISLTLNWTKATDAVSSQAALQYEVCQSTSNNVTTTSNCESASIIRSFTADINTFAVTGLVPEQSYYFNVVVKDEAGNKTPYTPVNAVTGACVPTHLTFTSQPSSANMGSSLGTITLAVKDSSENTCPSNTSTVTLTNKGGTCTGMTLGGSVSGAAAAGLFTTSSATESGNTGSCTLHATDGALTSADSSSFVVNGVIITGTGIASINEGDIVTGGKTLIATVTGTTWVAGVQTIDISVVGTMVRGVANNAQVTLTFTVPPIQDDVVFVCGGHHNGGGSSVTPVTSGYNQIINDTASNPYFGCWYKRMGASPDTTVVMPADGTANNAAAWAAIVLRGVHTDILDTTSTTAGPTASTNPNPAAVTTVTDNTLVLIFAISTSNDTAPGTVTNYTLTGSGTTGLNVSGTDASVGSGYRLIATAGTNENPPAWSAWTTGTWKAITIPVKRLGPFDLFNTQRVAIANGLVSAQNETHSWNTEVTPAITPSSVVRTSDTVATVTLPAVPAYNITATENLSWAIPGSSLVSGSLFNAIPNFTITASASCTPHHPTITVQPSSALLGASLGTLTVEMRDSGGILCNTATSSITLSKNASATWGTLSSASNPTLVKSAVNGVATWTDLVVTTTAGVGSIDVTALGQPAISNSITISSPPSLSGPGAAPGLRRRPQLFH